MIALLAPLAVHAEHHTLWGRTIAGLLMLGFVLALLAFAVWEVFRAPIVEDDGDDA